ncbi:MAG: LytTR family DNA-binding domain-containing protein [Oscillospiraceae bacterium]
MNIAIVEDEASDREFLLDCLALFSDDTKNALSISTFDCADAFLNTGTPARYDVIFLDIYLGDATGMEVARKLRDAGLQSQLVFVTTSSAHAVASYEVAATYYLLKPYSYEQFTQMMEAVMNRNNVDETSIAVKVNRGVEKVPLSSILYVDYADHSVFIHTTTRNMRTYVPFQEVEEQLRSYPQFLACYRNVLINMDKVDKLEGDHFLLQKGYSVPITRNCVREMRETYTAYLFARMRKTEK